MDQAPEQYTNISKILSTLRYLLVIIALVFVWTQLVNQIIPYEQITTGISSAIRSASDQILVGVRQQINDPTLDSNGSANNSIVTILVTLFLNLIVTSIIVGVQLGLLLVVVVAVVGILILSQNRNLLETIMLVVSFALPRQRKNWGFIYDQETNGPVPFAVVRVVRPGAAGTPEVVNQTVADLDGRYRIYFQPGGVNQFLQVSAAGYMNRISSLDTTTRPEITDDIPLTPLGQRKQNWRENLFNARPKLIRRFMRFIYALSIAAFLFAIYAAITQRSAISLIAGVAYGIGVIWNTIVMSGRMRNKVGKVIDVENNAPLESAFIRILDKEKTVQSGITTDINGEAKFSLRAGNYMIEVSKSGYAMVNGYDLGSTKVEKIRINEKGYLTKNILMKRAGEAGQQQAPSVTGQQLMNPFDG